MDSDAVSCSGNVKTKSESEQKQSTSDSVTTIASINGASKDVMMMDVEDDDDDAEGKDDNCLELVNKVNRKRKLSEIERRKSGDDDSSPTEFLGFPNEDIEEPLKMVSVKKEMLEQQDEHSKTVDEEEEEEDDDDDTETKELIRIKTEPVFENDADPLALRKGKRSRIPNKRYETSSSSSLSLTRTPLRDSMDAENGSEFANSENGDDDIEMQQQQQHIKSEDTSGGDVFGNAATSTSTSPLKKSNTRPSFAGQPPLKKPKVFIDMSNPLFLEPFSHGWRRELVYRQTYDSNLRRNGDVYYYTPGGKKVRSMREVIEHLDDSKALTVKNFTFFKEPVGVNDTTKEIVREAKQVSPWALNVNRKGAKKGKSKLTNTTFGTPKGPVAGRSPRIGGSFKVKFPGSSRAGGSNSQKSDRKRSGGSNNNNNNNNNNAEMEIGMLPPIWSPKRGSGGKQLQNWQQAKMLDGKPFRRPCSIRCGGLVMGLVPTLQCRLCLCLYHKECVGELFDDVLPDGYVCKNCQLDIDETSSSSSPYGGVPPPLTPISAMKSSISTLSITPPKLQRIPKSIIDDVQEQQQQSSSSSLKLKKTIVGSVTTWFPPNSTIKMNDLSDHNNGIMPPKPQSLVHMGERKYLVVPKGNVLSISPTVSALTPPASYLHIATGDEAPPHTLNESPREVASLPKTRRSLLTNNKKPPAAAAATLIGTSTELQQQQQQHVHLAKTVTENRFMQNYLQNVSYGYQTLLNVFQYLKVQDLLRAGCVCTMWRDIAAHPSLWKIVRLKNSQVSDWEGLADSLQKHGTETLDLRKMLLPTNNGGGGAGASDTMWWPLFSKAISRIDTLQRIEFCRCPASVVQHLIKTNRNLKVLNAMTIKCETLDISDLQTLDKLEELRLKSTNGFSLNGGSDLTPLKTMVQLKHLSLTSVKDLHKLNIHIIGNLVNLESLDLGECCDFPQTFGTNVIEKLLKLEKLRLEKGQGQCNTFSILEAVGKIPQLEQLELVNFDVKAGFDEALGACTNIKKLLIIPTYISQSATTNHMVLGGVMKLKSTLSHFVWGVTLELLRVTELFVDQCEDSPNKERKKPSGSGDSIPVLKPVPIIKNNDESSGSGSIESAATTAVNKEPPQVEILPLPTLQKLLLNCLPTTRVKILKIPFHATWRQSIVDTVN